MAIDTDAKNQLKKKTNYEFYGRELDGSFIEYIKYGFKCNSKSEKCTFIYPLIILEKLLLQIYPMNVIYKKKFFRSIY